VSINGRNARKKQQSVARHRRPVAVPAIPYHDDARQVGIEGTALSSASTPPSRLGEGKMTSSRVKEGAVQESGKRSSSASRRSAAPRPSARAWHSRMDHEMGPPKATKTSLGREARGSGSPVRPELDLSGADHPGRKRYTASETTPDLRPARIPSGRGSALVKRRLHAHDLAARIMVVQLGRHIVTTAKRGFYGERNRRKMGELNRGNRRRPRGAAGWAAASSAIRHRARPAGGIPARPPRISLGQPEPGDMLAPGLLGGFLRCPGLASAKR